MTKIIFRSKPGVFQELICEKLSELFEVEFLHIDVSFEDARAKTGRRTAQNTLLFASDLTSSDEIVDLFRFTSAKVWRVVLICDELPHPFASKFFGAGGCGCIPKNMSLQGFLGALDIVLSGGSYLPAEYSYGPNNFLGQLGELKLSESSHQILALVREGMSNKEISRILNLSDSQIKMRIRALCSKLGAKNRTQLAVYLERLDFAHKRDMRISDF